MLLGMILSGYKVRGCPGSILGCGLKKEKKACIIYMFIYLICNIYCIYLICILCIYVLHICVKSKVCGI